MEDLETQAVAYAQEGQWPEAIKLNQKILKENPDSVSTLNRLAYCFCCVGQLAKAKKTYQKVLKLDPYNTIAPKNLAKLTVLKSKKMNNSGSFLPEIFLEEPGKTKVVNLINLAPATKLYMLRPSQPVTLLVRRKSVLAFDEKKNYLGALPDDLSFRLAKFMKNGYTYLAFVKSCEKGNLSILIREIKRSGKLKNQPTFLVGNPDLSFTPFYLSSPDEQEDSASESIETDK